MKAHLSLSVSLPRVLIQLAVQFLRLDATYAIRLQPLLHLQGRLYLARDDVSVHPPVNLHTHTPPCAARRVCSHRHSAPPHPTPTPHATAHTSRMHPHPASELSWPHIMASTTDSRMHHDARRASGSRSVKAPGASSNLPSPPLDMCHVHVCLSMRTGLCVHNRRPQPLV